MLTVAQLYEHVAQLGFEDSLESDKRFYLAANRALLQVNDLRPATAVYLINHRPLQNKVSAQSVEPLEKIDELSFEAEDVKSFYFEADGTGSAYLECFDGAGGWELIAEIELASRQSFVPYRGFIKRDGFFTAERVRLRFAGDFFYTVRNLAMYGQILSDAEEDIPAFESFTRYDMSKLVDDFLGLCSPPILELDEFHRLNQGYDVENGRIILLPRGSSGCFKVSYQRRPRALIDEGNAAGDSSIVDLDADLAALLPELTAAYVLAEDEAQLANYYLSLYRARAGEIVTKSRNTAPVAFKNKNGW